MSQFKLELFANPICSLGDREKSTLNSLKPRPFIYKMRIANTPFVDEQTDVQKN